MRIGIIGFGVVGSATAEAFKEHEVRIYDVIPSKATHSLSKVLSSDIIFICLPTPQKRDSLECDTSALDNLFCTIALDSHFVKANLVLRSTVPIGYTKRAREILGLENLVHSPEFLTARTAKEDACNPVRMVIGEPNWTPNSEKTKCADKLQELYENRWPYSWNGTTPIFFMSSDESEAVKLFQNSFSAVKIAFFNEIHSLSKKLGLDWQRCLEALLAGGWVNPQHTQVPGPDGKFGFGGTCLPKDLANLVSLMGDEAQVTKAALIRNWEDRKR